MDKPNNDKDCFADRPDPRTEDLFKPGDAPTGTQLQDQSLLLQNWTRSDEHLAVHFSSLNTPPPRDSDRQSEEIQSNREAQEILLPLATAEAESLTEAQTVRLVAMEESLKSATDLVIEAVRALFSGWDNASGAHDHDASKNKVKRDQVGPESQDASVFVPRLHKLITPLDRKVVPTTNTNTDEQQRDLNPEQIEQEGAKPVKERPSEVKPIFEPGLDLDGRPSDRPFRPGDAMPRKIDYEALAKKITDSGKIPESIENALKNGVGHPGLDLDELNKILGPKGFYIDKTAMKTGLMATLYKNGVVVDCVVAKTPAAQQKAERMLSKDTAAVSKGISDLTKEMMDDGISSQSIKKALEKGVGGTGLDLEELNSILGPEGFYFDLVPSETGLRANLHQNGEVIDFVNVRTPEARKIAEQILREEKVDYHTGSAFKSGAPGEVEAVQIPPAFRLPPPGVIGSVPSSDSGSVPAEYSLPGGGNVPILDRTSIVKALATGAEAVNSALYRENKVVKALAIGALKGLK